MSKGKALVSVQVRNVDINKALKIFKKRGFDSGHLMELRERQEYTKPTVTKRKKKLDAVRRQNMQTIIEKIESGDKHAKLPTKKIKKK